MSLGKYKKKKVNSQENFEPYNSLFNPHSKWQFAEGKLITEKIC